MAKDRNLSRAILWAVLVLAVMTAAPASSHAQAPDCLGPIGTGPPPAAASSPLRFGIYPGGGAGQLVLPAASRPEDSAAIEGALAELRGAAARPFNVHLYLSFTGKESQESRVRSALAQITRYSQLGYSVEYVLTYRPEARRGAADVADWVVFVRSMVRRMGAAGLASLQVTNEVNNITSPDSSDGAFPGARDALVQGVIAADAETRSAGFEALEIGFNWFYRLDPDRERDFWTEIGRKGGRPFVEAVDWIGLDAYPGTFFPPANAFTPRDAMINAMSVLRTCYAPMAGIGADTPMHIIENGYPTGAGRSTATQAAVMDEMIRAVHDYRGNYNVTSYNWFDLRDGDSSNPDFGQQYGIMTDTYAPKPAFALYRGLIEQLAERPGTAVPAVARQRPRLRRTIRSRAGRAGWFAVRTNGRLLRPAGVSAATGCAGRVSVRVRAGRRTISSRVAPVRRDCTFSSRVIFRDVRRSRRSGRLRVDVRFQGNARLLPVSAPRRAVRGGA